MDAVEPYIALNFLTAGNPRYAGLLIAFFGSVAEAVARIDASSAVEAGIPERFVNTVLEAQRRDFAQQLDKAASWLNGDGRFLLIRGCPDYPALLNEIDDAPLLLFCDGDARVLDTLRFAMVGSRSPTRAGIRTAKQFAGQLAGAGVTIVSGLAMGIDGAAHEGALDAGGKSIAVLGTGCDVVYPARHRRLAARLRDNGLLMSEFPLGTLAIPTHFPQRNRIVTGLSLGTLVVEATLKSGSLVSARLAMEQGREVFAIPGSIRDRQSRGCHQLIRQGAKLTESPQDIVEELDGVIAYELEQASPLPMPALTETQQALLAAISNEPVSADALKEATGLPVSEVTAALIDLEVSRLIERRAGGFVRGQMPG